MRFVLFLTALLSIQIAVAQTSVKTKRNGVLEFVELDHGLARTERGMEDTLQATPTGTHGWLKDFEIIKITDSIEAAPKASFGTVYMVRAKDTVDVDVVIEWIYPQVVVNEKGEQFKSIKYATRRPTNIPSASSYSLDAPYEMVKGKWVQNMYLENKLMYTRTFYLY
jgi:hypothetical protein